MPALLIHGNPDTARLFPELVARNVPAISITDSLLSPIVEGASVVFEIQDMPEPALRTLSKPYWAIGKRGLD